MSFKALSNLIKVKINASPVLRTAAASLVIETANEWLAKRFGTGILEQARAAYFKNHILAIACLDQSAEQSIRQIEGPLIEEIDRRLGGKVVQSISFLGVN